MKYIKYLFILFSILLLFYAAYVITQKNAAKEQTGQVVQETEEVQELRPIRIGICGLDTMNPLITQNKEVINVSKLLFEPLLALQQDGSLQNVLAQECSKTSDVTYVIKLNTERKWQDGTNIIGKDVQFTIDRLKENRSIYSANVQEVSSVEVIDDTTVKITLAQAVPYFEYRLEFPILCSHAYDGEDFYTTSKLPISSGMYKMVSQEGNTIVLNKNVYYPQYADIRTEEVKIFSYTSMGEVYNSFKLGNIDVLTTSNTNLQDYIGSIGYAVKEAPGREYDFLSFNCSNAVLSKKEVREAISDAIDKASIVANVYNNTKIVAGFPLDYGHFLYKQQETSAGYNPDKAKQVLEQAGWTYSSSRWKKTENYQTLRLSFSITVDKSNAQRVQVAELIKTQLENIGIRITVNSVSKERYQTLLKNRDYEILLTGVESGISPDLSYFFGEGNVANYTNAEAQECITTAQKISGYIEGLQEQYTKLIDLYRNDIPFIGLYRNKISLITNQTIAGEIQPTFYTSYYHFETWKNY